MKAILIDDEQLALDYLEFQINKISTIEIIGKYTNCEVIHETSKLNASDLVFLDIEMPGMNGLELAERLLEINPSLSIIFVTAYKEYAVDAFDLNALDYLLKPVQLDRLEKMLNRLIPYSHNQTILTSKPNQLLYINVCKELSFQRDDHQEFIHWRTAKTQELFLFLLHHVNQTVNKSTLIDVLWNNIDQSKAYSQLYNAIYHVRDSLKKFYHHLKLKSVTDGYILLSKDVHIDIVEWEGEILSSTPINQDTLEKCVTIMNLYKGSYLQDYNYIWAESDKYRLDQLWKKTAYQIAYIYLKQNESDKAEEWYMKICDFAPEEENAHFSLMNLYAKLGLGLLVTHQYERLQNALEDLGLPISTEIQEWYTKWYQNKKVARNGN